MSKQITVPFGPQHPVLPEPLHLDLVLEDEKVVDVIPTIGYVHRGLEKLVEKREFTEYTYIAERTCGICSFIHGATFCQGIEEIMKIERISMKPPEKARIFTSVTCECCGESVADAKTRIVGGKRVCIPCSENMR